MAAQSAFKILLVEDDELFRSTIKKSIKRKFSEVSEAVNGKVAREMLTTSQFDLVISDIQMPHFSGIDLLEWTKKNRPIPFILMTGFSQALETKNAHEIGADGFLAKPFNEDELFEVLNKFAKQAPEPAVELVDLDDQFCKVFVEEFLSEKETEVNVYIRISNLKYIKIAHTGHKISEERVKLYKEKGVNFVYVRKEDFPKIVKFNLQVAKVANKSNQISQEKKINFMKQTGALILENAFVNGVELSLIRQDTFT